MDQESPSALSGLAHNTPHVNSDHANTNKTDNMGVAVPELKQYDHRPTHVSPPSPHTQRVHNAFDLGETRRRSLMKNLPALFL